MTTAPYMTPSLFLNQGSNKDARAFAAAGADTQFIFFDSLQYAPVWTVSMDNIDHQTFVASFNRFSGQQRAHSPSAQKRHSVRCRPSRVSPPPAGRTGIFEVAVALHPTDVGAHSDLGEAHLAMADTAKAIKSFERVLQLDPSSEFARSQLGKLRRQ